MSREVRRVAADWEHPKTNRHGDDRYEPLLEGYSNALVEFEAMWKEKGLQETLDYFGVAPNKDEYMPEWPDEERTHYQMYEDTTEGTPISPVMPDPETLAQWLVDNKASAFARDTATYEQWLNIAKGAFAPSMVIVDGKMMSGVEASLPPAEDPEHTA